MSKVKEIIWPDEFSDLKRIEDTMVCGICYEYMDTPVMTPCSHNYCSMCIRKYLHYKQQCPACFQACFEKDLYINRSLGVLIQHYLQLREKLKTLIQNRNVYNSVMMQEDEESTTPPIRPSRSSPSPKSPKVVAEKKKVEQKTVPSSPLASTSKNIISTPSGTSKPNFFSPSSVSTSKSNFSSPSMAGISKSNFSSPTSSKLSKSSLPSIAKIFSTPKRKETSTQPFEVDVKSVPCPVCSVDISESHINVHLDACLKRENIPKEVVKPKPNKSKHPPLPKLVLRVMKDAELRKKMKDLGLSTQGDRRALENRFTRYSVIYNAESDKLDPRPIPDLIRQCELEEKQEKSMDFYLVPAAGRLQIDKNAKEEKIEEAQKNYRVANKSSFDKLIEEVKNRRRLEKEQQQQNAAGPSNPGPSSENIPQTVEKNEPKLPNEIPYQDSDSEDSCPLVHYERDGQKNFCSVSLSASNSPLKSQEKTIMNKQVEVDISKATEVDKNVDEVTVDVEESSDDEIVSSPTSEKDSHSIEKKNREAAARDMCKSIIDDFSFEEWDDEKSMEFGNNTMKEKKDEKDVDEDEVDESLVEINNFNRLKLQKNSGDEKSSNEEFGDDKSDDAFPLEILNGDSFDEFVNNSHLASEIINGSLPDKVEGTEAPCLTNGLEKENDALSANENSQQSVEDGLRRPVRKRNRPARFGDPKEETNESVETESLELSDNSVQDVTLKRRRGRQKANPAHNTSDEVQNPPKRPVRRRQAQS